MCDSTDLFVLLDPDMFDRHNVKWRVGINTRDALLVYPFQQLHRQINWNVSDIMDHWLARAALPNKPRRMEDHGYVADTVVITNLCRLSLLSDLERFCFCGGDAGELLRNNRDQAWEALLRKTDASLIVFMQDQPVILQQWAYEQDYKNVRFLEDATDDMRLFFVQQDGLNLRYLRNPNRLVCLMAVLENGQALEWVPKPASCFVQLAAVDRNPYAIHFVDARAPVELFRRAVARNTELINDVTDRNTVKKLVKETPELLIYLEDQELARELAVELLAEEEHE